MTQIKPDIIFIDAHIADISDNYGDHLRDTRRAPLRNFLLKHNARLIARSPTITANLFHLSTRLVKSSYYTYRHQVTVTGLQDLGISGL